MSSQSFISSFAILGLLTTSATAFFKIECPNRLVLERADPIISPGQISAHVHTVVGGNGFAQSMDYAKTQTATCSSCKVPQDKSNYWTPSMYFHNGNGSFVSVPQLGGFLIYYLVKFGMGEDESAVSAFKPGFRMAIGDPFARAFAGTPAADAVKFLCHEGEGEPVHGFPSAPCPGGIRMRLIFPSCSNGELDSADHKSHMAYPSEIESGDCPEGFKIRTPTLLYESVWKTEEFDNMWSGNGNPFVLSNGDPTGYGLHGDFLNGWDVDVLQDAVLNCKDGNQAADNLGNIKFCPVLAPTLYSDDQTHMCKLESTTGEKVEGELPALAGCNPVQPGPGPANRNPSCGGNQQVTPMLMTMPSAASEAARKPRRRRNFQQAGAHMYP